MQADVSNTALNLADPAHVRSSVHTSTSKLQIWWPSDLTHLIASDRRRVPRVQKQVRQFIDAGFRNEESPRTTCVEAESMWAFAFRGMTHAVHDSDRMLIIIIIVIIVII